MTDEKAPAQADNAQVENQEKPMVSLPQEKVDDWKRKLSGSRAEAMRLKAQAERLAEEKAKLAAELEAARTGQAQTVNYTPTPEEIALFRQLAQQAGVPTQQDIEAIRQAEWNKEQQLAVDEFLKDHPEYNRPGDEESDAAWEEIKAEVKSYKTPQNPREYLALLRKAHKVVAYDPQADLERGVALGVAQANLKEQGKLGGGGGSTKHEPQKKVPAEKKAVMDGFKSVRPEAFS